MSNRMKDRRFQSNIHHQHGAILAAVLMITLVVTILGITAINTASLEGRLAHNYQERALAFQAAEQALRSAEQLLEGLTTEPVACSTSGCTVWTRNALQNKSITDSGNTAQMWWEFQDTAWWQAAGATDSGAGNGSMALYLIEERAFVQNNVQANIIGSGLNYYTITAIGTRNGSGAEVVLQSHYMKRFN